MKNRIQLFTPRSVYTFGDPPAHVVRRIGEVVSEHVDNDTAHVRPRVWGDLQHFEQRKTTGAVERLATSVTERPRPIDAVTDTFTWTPDRRVQLCQYHILLCSKYFVVAVGVHFVSS